MANIKKKGRFGIAPTTDDILNENLLEPDIPAIAPKATRKKKIVDGRSLRKTGRTLQFNTKVTSEFLTNLRTLAQKENQPMTVILERALEEYKKKADSK